jgi:hypothetical protein
MNRFARKGVARPMIVAAALAVAVLALGATACGEEHESEVVEGEPIELGDLLFNVQLTRFLNIADREDAEYLEDLKPPPNGKAYLGVFMEVENEGDEDAQLPTAEQMTVLDTTGQTYKPIETETVFGFDFGQTVPAGEAIPLPDTAVASGPIQGQIIIFLVDQSVSENRPLELELEAEGEHGIIELDI